MDLRVIRIGHTDGLGYAKGQETLILLSSDIIVIHHDSTFVPKSRHLSMPKTTPGTQLLSKQL